MERLKQKEMMTNEKLTLKQLIIGLLMGIIACAMITLCTGCKSVETVVVKEQHTDTLMITKHQRDSVWLHDSIRVTEKGDTVRIEKWHTKYIEKAVHDTLYQSKRDSIPYPVEVIKEVPAKLTWWQQTRLHLANILLYLLLLVGVIYIGKKHIKRLL
jgi:cell division protein FtsL